jgi:hypothetical protein
MNSVQSDNNGRNLSGSVWIIYDSLLDDYSGVGETVDMSNPTKYNTRYDGAKAGDIIGDVDVNVADVDNDGKLDLMIGSVAADIASRNNSGAVYVIYNTLLDDHPGVGQNVDLLISTNYNILYYGSANEKLAIPPTLSGDIDGDGKTDLVLGGQQADYNSRTDSGAIYVVYSSLMESYSAVSQSVDLANPINYNIRFDGSEALGALSYHYVASVDVDNDGKLDIVSNAPLAGNNSRQYSGSLYVFYGSLLARYSGLGNNIDTASVYSLRYDGATDWLDFPGGDNMRFVDMNNDGKLDLLAGAAYVYTVDPDLRDAGYVYLIYNFPHTISLNSTSTVNGDNSIITGTVSAPNSTTNISMVQYSVDSNSILGTWSDCSASDGSFDSKSEVFNCSVSSTLLDGSHTIYFRAYDTNISYTAQSQYVSFTESLLDAIESTSTPAVLPETGSDS